MSDADRGDRPRDADPKETDAEREDRPEEESDDYHGDAVTKNPRAPASAGIPHGSDGTVDPRRDSPDGRPSAPGRAAGDTAGEGDETPVPSPIERSGEGQGVRSGSAAAASRAAGSATPAEDAEEEDET